MRSLVVGGGRLARLHGDVITVAIGHDMSVLIQNYHRGVVHFVHANEGLGYWQGRYVSVDRDSATGVEGGIRYRDSAKLSVLLSTPCYHERCHTY